MKRSERLSAKDKAAQGNAEGTEQTGAATGGKAGEAAWQHLGLSAQHQCGIPESLACRQASAADRPQGTGARGAFA